MDKTEYNQSDIKPKISMHQQELSNFTIIQQKLLDLNNSRHDEQ